MKNNIKIMCTVTLNINEAQVRKLNPELTDMMSINRWAQQQMDNLIEDLIEEDNFAKEHLRPYTIEELHARIDEAEADIAAGRFISHEELMREMEEESARDKAEAKEKYLKPLTMAEINAMLDEAEANFAAGRGIPDEEVWREYDEECARERQELIEMAEAL